MTDPFQERAERICKLFRDESPVPDYLMPKIAAELRAVAEEAYRQGVEGNKLLSSRPGLEQAHAEGYRAGVEAAAEVAAESCGHDDHDLDGCPTAKAIRALKPTEGSWE